MWMYERLDEDRFLRSEFVEGVEEFMNFAFNHPEGDIVSGGNIRCPCLKCKNSKYLDKDTVTLHLYQKGFVYGYDTWYLHGEPYPYEIGSSSNYNPGIFTGFATGENVCSSSHEPHENTGQCGLNTGNDDPMTNFVREFGEPNWNDNIHEEPNPQAKRVYDMLEAAQQELWSGSRQSQLSVVAQLLSIKADHHFSEACYDRIAALIEACLPEDNNMVSDFYETKRLIAGLGLPVETIDCCWNNCMIYWGEDAELECCKHCGYRRYKERRRGVRRKANISLKKMFYFPITPRLQRLYASNATAKHMRWHAEHHTEDGVTRHPSDSEAWKHFDSVHWDFAAETRNIRLALCTDGFQPFGQSGQQYSSWPVILTVYNLPPNMCMKDEYMFLTVIIPGPQNPKQRLDIFLQPLISELKMLWNEGVETWDISVRQNFRMRAALLWTVSDFPAYSMLSGWSTAGFLACPYCMENSSAFRLQHGRKTSWFDNHRKFLPISHPFRRNRRAFYRNRQVLHETTPPLMTGDDIVNQLMNFNLMKVTVPGGEEFNALHCKGCGWKKFSIFWDLPYWRTCILRHNLDVMHIEKNIFDNMFNTVMSVEGKTKDNANARADMSAYTNRPELEIDTRTGKYVKACYTLDKSQKDCLLNWVKELKFPDGYVSNLGRCVDIRGKKMYGMKSHDCHVFMQRLVPIAFRHLLPDTVWEALTELSLFFKDLCCPVLNVEDVRRMESEIPIIICKLERIFPPSFFDVMEHLPVHLPYEARVAGPVQYRWMYPFERYISSTYCVDFIYTYF